MDMKETDTVASITPSEAVTIIERISAMDHRKATGMEPIFDLLFYASSACGNKTVRQAARFKMSLILRFLPLSERNKCLARLIDEIKTCKDSWLERNILESIYPYVEEGVLADILPNLDIRVQVTFEKMYKSNLAVRGGGELLETVSRRRLEMNRVDKG
jgi:hypothetical protein